MQTTTAPTSNKETLFVFTADEAGQYPIHEADAAIAHLNTTTGKTWEKDLTPQIYVLDETDEDINNPAKLKDGYCWIVRKLF